MSTTRDSRERTAPAGPSPGQSAHSHSWQSKNQFDSFRHAAEGILHTFRTQRNMRVHFLAFALVLVSGLVLRLGRLEIVALLLVASLVLVAEMINTAIEVVVDMISPGYHPAAKFAKDIAAGAVLIASLNAVAVGAILFLSNGRWELLRLRLQQPPNLYVFITGFILLLILLVWFKTLGQKGTLLEGGVVSGHAAIAFFLATTIVFLSCNVFVSALALSLALLVAQSRVQAHIHTVQEVVLGAALGLFLTASVYQLPVWFGQLLPAPPPHAVTSPR